MVVCFVQEENIVRIDDDSAAMAVNKVEEK